MTRDTLDLIVIGAAMSLKQGASWAPGPSRIDAVAARAQGLFELQKHLSKSTYSFMSSVRPTGTNREHPSNDSKLSNTETTPVRFAGAPCAHNRSPGAR